MKTLPSLPALRRTRLRTVLALGLLACPLGAAEPAAPKGPLDNLPEEIRRPLLQADELLRQQQWEAARALLQGILDEGARDYRWPGSYRQALWRLAAAEMGLGRTDDARWHWQALQAVGGPRPIDLPFLSGAAEALAHIPMREPGSVPADLPVDLAPGLVPPRRTAGEPLDLRDLQEGAPPLWAQVEVVVDAEGRVRSPAVVDGTSNALAYRVLEALRGWRYEPARRDGRPVATLVKVNVNTSRELPLGQVAPAAGPLADIDRLLLAGDWREARRRGDRLWSQALHNAEQTRPAFALLLTQRALAEAALGETDLAVCRWHAAQGLMPQLFDADLSAYGAAGALLEARRWGYPIGNPGRAPRQVIEGEVTRPIPRRQAKPELPTVVRRPGTRETVVIDSVIEKEGAITQPLVRPDDLGAVPNFAASALDALCRWRFDPATSEGQPVRVNYSVTINFVVRN